MPKCKEIGNLSEKYQIKLIEKRFFEFIKLNRSLIRYKRIEFQTLVNASLKRAQVGKHGLQIGANCGKNPVRASSH